MSVSLCEQITKDSWVVLWKIDEDLSFYLSYLNIHENDLVAISGVTHPQKKLEWLASRCCAKFAVEQCGLTYDGIDKDEYSNPFLPNHPHAFISISHTSEYTATVVSFSNDVGIDLEKISPKLQIVAHKFLSEQERPFAEIDLTHLCIYWCAKESLYKWYGKKNLSFKHNIAIQPFEIASTVIEGSIVLDAVTQTKHSLRVFHWGDYILTVTV
jgi:4'-phosphopantetheinyl transferase